MANAIGDVSLLGTNSSDNSFTYLCDSSMTVDDAGKPAALSAANTVHVAADGEAIDGYIEQVEDRELEGIKVATVTKIGFFKFKKKSGDSVAVKDSILGAGNGEVKKASLASTYAASEAPAITALATNQVVEVGSDYVVARLCR